MAKDRFHEVVKEDDYLDDQKPLHSHRCPEYRAQVPSITTILKALGNAFAVWVVAIGSTPQVK